VGALYPLVCIGSPAIAWPRGDATVVPMAGGGYTTLPQVYDPTQVPRVWAGPAIAGDYGSGLELVGDGNPPPPRVQWEAMLGIDPPTEPAMRPSAEAANLADLGAALSDQLQADFAAAAPPPALPDYGGKIWSGPYRPWADGGGAAINTIARMPPFDPFGWHAIGDWNLQ